MKFRSMHQNKRPLHITTPMAGESSRFMKEGWTMPKPLIKLNGRELFLHAIDSIGISGIEMRYSFIVQQKHIDEYGIDRETRAIIPHANIFTVQETTHDAVETCLMAREVIGEEDTVLVMDYNLEFTSQRFNALTKEILSKPVEKVNSGVLVSFSSNESGYSYTAINSGGFMMCTTEKEVIGCHILCGAYFFPLTRSFIYTAGSLMHRTNFLKPEYYVSLLYNYLLQRGKIVRLAEVEEYYFYEAPEELNQHTQSEYYG